MEDIEKNVLTCASKINDLLKDNKITALQFIISHNSDDNKLDTHSYYYAETNYFDLVDKFITEKGSLLQLPYDQNNQYKNLHNRGRKKVQQELKTKYVYVKVEKVTHAVKYSDWIQSLNNNKIGGCLIWTSFQPTIRDSQDFSYRLDSFLILNKKIYKTISPTSIFKSKKTVEAVLHLIDSFFLQYGIGIIYNKLSENILKHATKAALAQVMARNMSHNIGSHVLSALTKHEIHKILNDKKVHRNQYESLKTIERSNEENFTYFISYLKTRMDFLADITTSIPLSESIKLFVNDLLNGFDSNKILLNTISGVEDFNYKIIPKSDNEIIEEKDVRLAIPNDILGSHAFYIILENIIRNCAKHRRNIILDYIISFTIDIKTKTDGLYECLIYDNIPFESSSTITGEEPIQELIIDQNKNINNSILDENGILRKGAWGLIEMKAAAAYLRKIPIEQIDNEEYKAGIIKDTAYCENRNYSILKAIKVKGNYLGYQFYLLKPKELLVIDELGLLNEYYQIFNELDNLGIHICSEIGNKYNPIKVYPHKLVLCFSNKTKNEFLSTNMGGLSRRICVMCTNSFVQEMIDNIIARDAEEIITSAWIYYLKNKDKKLYSGRDLYCTNEEINENIDTSKKCAYIDHGEKYFELKATKEYAFIEVINSLSKNFEPSNPREELAFDESTSVRIVVIDERIQKYASSGTYNAKGGESIPIGQIYKSTNIIVPSETEDEINLNIQSFSYNYDKIINFIKKNSPDADFIVIHLGIIEKIIDSYNHVNDIKFTKDSNGITKFLMEVVFDKNAIFMQKLIITSGRGLPHNLPKNTRYLNFSIISQYLIDIRSKYLITEAVYNARRI